MSQHMDALALANELRLAQAAMLRELRHMPVVDAKQRAADLLIEPSETFGSIRIEKLLRSLPRYGDVRARKLLRRLGMPQGKLGRRVRELTERERRVLAAGLIADMPWSGKRVA